ncbi:hypothetical protein P4361_21295 [Fictibacillus sp. B-59209]|nr:hypothetical protein [Fictibacillus sp. B-59209]
MNRTTPLRMKDEVPLQPPVEDLHEQWSDDQIQALQHQLGSSIFHHRKS